MNSVAEVPSSTSARSSSRALLETLRAPLLLSPIADVTAGAALAYATWATATRAGPPLVADPTSSLGLRWVLAALVGIALLAAGMAQNALTDLDDDREAKRNRPLVRGDVSVESIRRLWRVLIVASLTVAWLISDVAGVLALTIVVLSAAYHHGLKNFRVVGCVALGACRAACLALGAVAVGRYDDLAALEGAMAASRELEMLGGRVPVVVLLYGLYVFGASLHASTDDEPEISSWSLAGTLIAAGAMGFLLCDLVLFLRIEAAPAVLGSVTVGGLSTAADLERMTQLLIAAGVLGVACWFTGIFRAARAAHRLPPGAITGVLLSNLYLFDAAVCFHAAQAGLVTLPIAGGLLALTLFGVSRLMLRSFPPT